MGLKLSLDLKNLKLNFLTSRGGWRIDATNSMLLLQFLFFLQWMDTTSAAGSTHTFPFLFLDQMLGFYLLSPICRPMNIFLKNFIQCILYFKFMIKLFFHRKNAWTFFFIKIKNNLTHIITQTNNLVLLKLN
jgi:hypothetical protein